MYLTWRFEIGVYTWAEKQKQVESEVDQIGIVKGSLIFKFKSQINNVNIEQD